MRNGKIARLPREIRNQLNQRLDDGESGETLLPWLNGLPEVQAVLTRQFAGVPLSKQNLHDWRTGGFAEWQARQEMLADARELSADAADVADATNAGLSDDLATVLAARYASALAAWDGRPTEEFQQQLKILRSLCRDIAELRRGDHRLAQQQLEQDWLEEHREKTEDELVARFEQWTKTPAVHDWLCQTWVSPEERIRRKREIFGLEPEDDAEADQETDADDEPETDEEYESETDEQDNPEADLAPEGDDDEAPRSSPDNATPAAPVPPEIGGGFQARTFGVRRQDAAFGRDDTSSSSKACTCPTSPTTSGCTAAPRDPKPPTPDPKPGSSPVKVSQGDDCMPRTGLEPSTPDEPHPTAPPPVGRPGGA